MELRAEYHELGTFLARLARLPRPVHVRSLEMRSADAPGSTPHARLQAVTFAAGEPGTS